MVALFVTWFPAIALMSADKGKYSEHPVLGTWAYEKNNCIEFFTFTSSGIRISKSDNEIVRAKYDIKTLSKEEGVYLLRDEVLEDNAMSDCSGSTKDKSGDVVVVLLHIQHEPERFSFCFDKKLKQCVGPFIKQKSPNKASQQTPKTGAAELKRYM